MKTTKRTAAGTFTNLPAWECRKCGTWQTGIDVNGRGCGPKTCVICKVPTKFRREGGIAECHTLVIKALAAKGWTFTFDIRLSVGLVSEDELRAAIVHAVGYRGLTAEDMTGVLIPAEKLANVWRAVMDLRHGTEGDVTHNVIKNTCS
jgi:hypothetical protein